MKTQILPCSEVFSTLREEWLRAQASEPFLQTPALRPELFDALGRNFSGIEVAVLEQGLGKGFLPFRRRGEFLEGVPMVDYQAVLSTSKQRWDITPVLRAANASAWNFGSLLFSQNFEFEQAWLEPVGSPRVDLHHGVDSYWAKKESEGLSFKNLKTKRRLVERDHGKLVFEGDSSESEVLDQILSWKSTRFGESSNEAKKTLEHLRGHRSADFAMLLATLRAGGKLIAAHYGIRANGILFYWFPAFNPEFSKYTPGWLMVEELIRHAPQFQYQVLDFGPGGEKYKWTFNNATIPITRGAFELKTMRMRMRKSQRDLMSKVRGTKLYEGLGPVRKLIRKIAS